MSPSSYPTYQRPSGWNALLPPRRGVRRLHDDRRCDVVIVGAGFTGIAAAARWAALEPAADIVVIDASTVGEGSPGRNSGFLLEISLANDADASNIARMRECNALISATMEDIRVAVAGSPLPCRLQRTGTYRAAAGTAGLLAIDAYAQFLQAAGLPFDELDRRMLQRRIGTTFYERGLYSPHCYLTQPAALIRSLLAALPERVALFEESPVINVARKPGTWAVSTPAATLLAPQVVLANNAFAKALAGGRDRVATVYTYAGLTAPLDATVLENLGSDTNWGLLPAHRLGTTLRRTDDGRILVRSFYGYEREGDNAAIAAGLANCLQRRYPQLENTEFDYVWSGATGFTLNGAPQWGEAAPGLFISAGCNGGGVVKGTLFGRLLADLALGRDVPEVRALFGSAAWMPPEPIRRLGFRVLSALEARRAKAEI